jgi:hypothetical protein
MADFLDISLLPAFSNVFTLLFVFVVVFAILEFTKIFGDNKGIHAIIALCLAFLLFMSPQLLGVVKFMTPWFVIIIILIMFLILSFRWMGVPEASITSTMSSWKTPHYFLVAIIVIIFIAALGNVYGNSLLPASDGANASGNEFQNNVAAAFFNTKVIGMVFIFMIAVFTILLLSGGPLVKR